MPDNWRDLWHAYFYKLADVEARTWEEELMRDVSHLNTQELADAVRALSRDDKTKYRPNLKSLRIRIYMERNRRAEGDGPEFDECALCSDGWIFYERQTGAYQGTFVGVPCLCSRGKHWLDRISDEYENVDVNGLVRLAKAARTQMIGELPDHTPEDLRDE